VETLLSLADTFESLELHVESQGALQEARSLVERKSQTENFPASLHHHQQGFASIKETKNARRILDQHTSTLHVGSKISLHGLQTKEMNEKEGTVTGPADNNRIGIQLQEGTRRVSIKILNIQYQEGPDKNRQTLYCNLVDSSPSRNNTLKRGITGTDTNKGEQTC